jgi:hypothetical protein
MQHLDMTRTREPDLGQILGIVLVSTKWRFGEVFNPDLFKEPFGEGLHNHFDGLFAARIWNS